MSIQTTQEITRDYAIKIIKERVLEIGLMPTHNDIFLKKMNIDAKNIEGFSPFTEEELNTLNKKVDFYSNKILEEILDSKEFRRNEFENYLIIA